MVKETRPAAGNNGCHSPEHSGVLRKAVKRTCDSCLYVGGEMSSAGCQDAADVKWHCVGLSKNLGS